MLPAATVVYSSTLYLEGVDGDSEMGRVGVHQSEYIILAFFRSQNALSMSCLDRIGAGEKCCVKPCLVSGEGLTVENCWMGKHVIRKRNPPPPEEAFLIPGRGDKIFINLFLLSEELLPAIVAILECTNRT